ncbi:hypothetical protein Q7P36_005915 [Cladosporium allicinum]
MEFSEFDLALSLLEASITIVSRNLLSRDVLECAASRLLCSWPMLSFRTSLTRSSAYESPTSSAYDGFFDFRTLDVNILPRIAGSHFNHGTIVYDATILDHFCKQTFRTWDDIFHPRLFTIQAVLTRDATILKFTLQHAAGDVLGLYNAANAFCEGLRGNVDKRLTRPDTGYQLLERSELQQNVKMSTALSGEIFITPQARAWWRNCTSSQFFLPGLIFRNLCNSLHNPPSWQLMYFPESTLEKWRQIARENGAAVSTFTLFASWMQLNFADHARNSCQTTEECFAITVNISEFLQNTQKPEAEMWNPLAIAIATPADGIDRAKRQRLVSGALAIRKSIGGLRSGAFMQDYKLMMSNAPKRQGRLRGLGRKSPATLLLTSWSGAPFQTMEVWEDSKHEREPYFVQPGITPARFVPTRGPFAQCGICWKGKSGGYWLSAKMDDYLWNSIADISSSI